MNRHVTFAVVTLQLLCLVVLSHQDEYCQWESFNATCPHNHVILVTSAFYGRMRIGRCVPYDYYVGCSTDVLDQLSSRCSGRQQCIVPIPAPELFKVHPCRKDLVAYMEASYQCVTVVGAPATELNTAPCDGQILLTGSSGYLSGAVARRTGYGTQRCPWLIRASPGQRIELTMFDFSELGSAAQHQHQQNSVIDHQPVPSSLAGRCTSMAMFYEEEASTPGSAAAAALPAGVSTADKYLRLCPVMSPLSSSSSGRSVQRKKLVYTSTSNQLYVHVINTTDESHLDHVLLRYDVVGCADLEVSPLAWSVRRGDTLTVFCNQTSDRWHLVCKSNTWVGNIGNCTRAVTASHRPEEAHKYTRNFPLGLLVAIAIGVISGVVIGFLLLLVIFACRKRFQGVRPPTEHSVLLVNYENQQNAYKLVDLKMTSGGGGSDGVGSPTRWTGGGHHIGGSTSGSPAHVNHLIHGNVAPPGCDCNCTYSSFRQYGAGGGGGCPHQFGFPPAVAGQDDSLPDLTAQLNIDNVDTVDCRKVCCPSAAAAAAADDQTTVVLPSEIYIARMTSNKPTASGRRRIDVNDGCCVYGGVGGGGGTGCQVCGSTLPVEDDWTGDDDPRTAAGCWQPEDDVLVAVVGGRQNYSTCDDVCRQPVNAGAAHVYGVAYLAPFDGKSTGLDSEILQTTTT